MKPFTEEARYEYPLTYGSLVIDLGFYQGRFTQGIWNKYRCRIMAFEPILNLYEAGKSLTASMSGVSIHHFGVGGFTRNEMFTIKGDMTGLFADGKSKESVIILGIGETLERFNIDQADLLKVNIEGMEFELLETILHHRLATRFGNIQVQFHPVVPDAEDRWQSIRNRLLKTHDLTYDAPWVWENYLLQAGMLESQSQAGQDIFVWNVLGRPSNGTFLDIGSSHPRKKSNTWALERLGWNGICVDNDAYCASLMGSRRAHFIHSDASKVHWSSVLLPYRPVMDYLSLDVDASSLATLMSLPLGEIRFKVITIEHDAYRFDSSIRHQMREHLLAHGYDLVCSDVKDKSLPFEDWWVRPDLVDMSIADRLRSDGENWQKVLDKL